MNFVMPLSDMWLRVSKMLSVCNYFTTVYCHLLYLLTLA